MAEKEGQGSADDEVAVEVAVVVARSVVGRCRSKPLAVVREVSEDDGRHNGHRASPRRGVRLGSASSLPVDGRSALEVEDYEIDLEVVAQLAMVSCRHSDAKGAEAVQDRHGAMAQVED